MPPPDGWWLEAGLDRSGVQQRQGAAAGQYGSKMFLEQNEDATLEEIRYWATGYMDRIGSWKGCRPYTKLSLFFLPVGPVRNNVLQFQRRNREENSVSY